MVFWEHLERWLAKLSESMNAVATAWIGVLMVVSVADVLGREILNRPFHGATEIVSWSIVAIVFLQIPHCLRRGHHVRSDFILGLVPPAAVAWLNLSAHVLGMSVFALIFYGSWSSLIQSWRILEYEGEGVIEFPIYLIRTIITFGALIFALEFLFCAAKDVRALMLGGYPESKKSPRGAEAIVRMGS